MSAWRGRDRPEQPRRLVRAMLCQKGTLCTASTPFNETAFHLGIIIHSIFRTHRHLLINVIPMSSKTVILRGHPNVDILPYMSLFIFYAHSEGKRISLIKTDHHKLTIALTTFLRFSNAPVYISIAIPLLTKTLVACTRPRPQLQLLHPLSRAAVYFCSTCLLVIFWLTISCTTW